MEKAGYTKIPESKAGGNLYKCMNCGGKATYKVTFSDTWSKLIVPLCEECSGKKYEDLRLQSTFDWD